MEGIKNATIESTKLGFDRGVFLTFWLHLDYGGSGQGAGGYILHNTNFKDSCPTIIISDLLNTLMVTKWEDLAGTHIRVKTANDKVVAVGHFLKDKWFVFEDITKYHTAKEEE